MKNQSSTQVPEKDPAESILAWHAPEARYATILETSLDAIITIDQAGKITDWNPAAEEIFGYTCALAMGREAAGFIAPGPATHRTEFLQSLKTGKGRLIGKRTEMTALRANGGEFPIELTLTRALDHGPPCFTACIRDITERKRTECTLRKSEERFRLLVESVEDYAIYLLDLRGRILTWNAGAERIEGYRARDIIGRRFNRLYTPDDIARGKPQQALVMAAAEGRYSDEGWSMRQDGSRYWASILLTALRDEHGVLFGYSRIGRDRTRRREVEIEAGRLTAELENRLRERTAELHVAMQLLRQSEVR
ncbi:MAG TPA: PAS domain S-box protein [Opitutaceae bacterium]|nr:PAS domain S-box protein [Opitutaceae bacterium]